jgi:hypothetical protein
MKVTEKILQQLKRIAEDTIFGYEQLYINKEEYQTAAKALERLQKKGVIKKVSKGIFYKPKMTIFGELKPSEEEILKPYLFQGQKRIAYVTGTFLYRQLGLTTQMAFEIKIASRSKRIYINTGAIKAKPVKSYTDVTEENYEILGFLDAMKDLKIIPDVDTKSAINIFSNNIQNLNNTQIQIMIEYAILYPPRVRALLGAILEQINRTEGIEKLKESLNPLTSYNLSIKKSSLKTIVNWNIK